MDKQQFFTVLFMIFLILVGVFLGIAFCGYRLISDFEDDGILEFGMGEFKLISPESVCWETLSKPSPSASDCLKISENDFDLVCNEVFKDEFFCIQLWDSTLISFDPENNECLMTLPFECGVN